MTGARDLSQGVRRENLQSGHETVQAKAMNLEEALPKAGYYYFNQTLFYFARKK